MSFFQIYIEYFNIYTWEGKERLRFYEEYKMEKGVNFSVTRPNHQPNLIFIFYNFCLLRLLII